ncbi:hypothetical protein Pvag_pPag20094 (plasmid) [Pantoea vagans C9-1]|nr:hypothetical protein Pvag_pPag20094 [Pantoea vagans C9-1]
MKLLSEVKGFGPVVMAALLTQIPELGMLDWLNSQHEADINTIRLTIESLSSWT